MGHREGYSRRESPRPPAVVIGDSQVPLVHWSSPGWTVNGTLAQWTCLTSLLKTWHVKVSGLMVWIAFGSTYRRTVRSLSEFAMTLTEDSAMAAAATTGESSSPKNGYRMPAASGIPATL